MKYFLSRVLYLLSCLILFSCNSHDARVNAIAKIGDPPPDFSLKDIRGEIDKKGRLAKEYRGFTDDLDNEISAQAEKIV